MKKLWLIALLISSISACTTQPRPSVIDRSPNIAKKKVNVITAKPASNKDWQPATHTVVKGDTLFSLGLQYNEYYKDIAALNNLTEPYIIKIGQQLKIKEPANTVATTTQTATNTATTDAGLILVPLKKENVVSTVTTGSAVANTPPMISEPKATREPYSEQAMLAKLPAQTKPVEVTKPVISVKAETAKPDVKPDLVKPEATKPAAKPANSTDNIAENITWAWPTKGKVITQFNDTANAKGIDISGTLGQAITAAASGKVIYTGSDLRGYGKLVIVKHDKNYLSVYAHNSKILVKEGSIVAKGDKISEMGNTDTDKIKLHFEIRQEGKSVDPMKFLGN